MKSSLFFTVFLFFSLFLLGQTPIFLDQYTVCHIEGQIELNRVDVSAASSQVVKEFEEVLKYSPFLPNYTLYRCRNLKTKVFAGIEETTGDRVIVYDEKYLAEIAQKQDEKWAIVFAIAHEVGHHVAGHTLKNNHLEADELAADYFAGYVMAMMKAEQEQVIHAFENLTPHPNDGVHPEKPKRGDAILEGWGKGRIAVLTIIDSIEKPCLDKTKGEILIQNNTNATVILNDIYYNGSMLPNSIPKLTIAPHSSGKLSNLPIGTHTLTYKVIENTKIDYTFQPVYNTSITIRACDENNRHNIK